MILRLVLLGASVFLGCAAQQPLAPLDPRHPASPAGAEAPLRPPSATLMPSATAGHPEQGEMATAPTTTGHDQGMTHGGGAHTMRSHAVRPEAPQDLYTCPMHPDVRQATAGRCPKCGMTLVKRSSPQEKPEGGHAH